MGPPFPWSFCVDLFLQPPLINLSLTFFGPRYGASLQDYRGLHSKRTPETLGPKMYIGVPNFSVGVPSGTPKAYKVTPMLLTLPIFVSLSLY